MEKKLDTFVAFGKIENGKLVLKNDRYFRGMIAFFTDCPVRVVIERVKRGRSSNQNAYYWGVVLPEIALHTGHAAEELHEIFKAKYLKRKHVWRGGEILTIKSTTDLTTGEFAEYLSNVLLEAADLGIEIPEADKAYQFK